MIKKINQNDLDIFDLRNLKMQKNLFNNPKIFEFKENILKLPYIQKQ